MIIDTKELNSLFLNFGYSEEDYLKIINDYSLNHFKEETLIKNVTDVYNYLLKNYNKAEIIKMTKSLPAIYGLSKENIKQKLEDIMSIGYTKDEVIKMAKTLPAIYSYSKENMKQKQTDLMTLGYTKAEVIKMTKTLPAIYSYSIETMKQKQIDLMTLGYTKDAVIKMTKTLPSIYGLSKENMSKKIEFYDSVCLHDIATISPKYLMQSANLSYARYMFLREEKNIIIDMTNYSKLFYNNKNFEKQYGITKEEILKKYDYDKYLEEKKEMGGLK